MIQSSLGVVLFPAINNQSWHIFIVALFVLVSSVSYWGPDHDYRVVSA